MNSSGHTDRTYGLEVQVECNTLSPCKKVSLTPIDPFNSDWVFPPGVPGSYKDDLFISHFAPSRDIWAGHPGAKVAYDILGAQLHVGHVRKATEEPFHLADMIPLAVGIADAMSFPNARADEFIRSEWDGQLLRHEAIGAELDPLQTVWADAALPAIRQAAAGVKPVLISHLLAQLGKWGSRWIRKLRTDVRLSGLFHRTAFSGG